MGVPPLSEDEQKLASNAVRDLRVTLSNFFLYAPENSMVQQSVDRFLQDLQGILSSRDQVTLGESEGQLILEGAPVDTKFTGSTTPITDLFLAHRIHSLTFRKGVECPEIVQLLQLLKPKALAPGETLSDALKRAALPHVQVNEKVFVAVKEGEKLISSADLGGEEDIEQAMESLRAFLGAFSKVKSDPQRQRILGVLGSQVGSLAAGGAAGGGPGGAGEGGWGDVVAGLAALRQKLSGVELHQDPKTAVESVDVLLAKISALLGGQGVAPPGSAPSAAEEEAQGQESLFEKATPLEEWRKGDFASLTDAGREAEVTESLSRLSEAGEAEMADAVWKRLWVATADVPEEGRCLLFRHLSRVPFEALSPERRVEAPGFLKRMMGEAAAGKNPEAFLECAGRWLGREGETGTLREAAMLVETATRVATGAVPAGPANVALAQKWLSTYLTGERLGPVLEAALRGDLPVESAAVFFAATGPEAGYPIVERAIALSPGDPARAHALDLLHRLQAEGLEILERWISGPGASSDPLPLLSILEKVPLPPSTAPVFESRWSHWSPEARRKVLDLAAKWECRTFRSLVLGELMDPSLEMVRHALKALPRIHRPGDAIQVVEAIEKRPHSGKEEKEEFTVLACHTLGEMADPISITPLTEWTQSHNLLERRKEKSMAVRVAAVTALGEFRSRLVEGHLEKMVQKETGELREAAGASLKKVRERLASAVVAEVGIPPSPEIPQGDAGITPLPAANGGKAAQETLEDLFEKPEQGA